MGDSVQVHVVGDPGMEMMPECCGCMCLNHSKNCVSRLIYFFYLFTNVVSRGRVLCVILESVGVLVEAVSHLVGLERGLKFYDFSGIPLGAPRLRAPRSWW